MTKSETLRAIAPLLGPSWDVRTDEHDRDHLRDRETGLELWARLDMGRWEFHVSRIDNGYRSTSAPVYPSITCAATKLPPALAADLKRRVLPEALVAFTYDMDSAHAWALHEDETRTAFKALAGLPLIVGVDLGDPKPERHLNGQVFTSQRRAPQAKTKGALSKVELYSDGYRIELTGLSLAKLRALLTLAAQ